MGLETTVLFPISILLRGSHQKREIIWSAASLWASDRPCLEKLALCSGWRWDRQGHTEILYTASLSMSTSTKANSIYSTWSHGPHWTLQHISLSHISPFIQTIRWNLFSFFSSKILCCRSSQVCVYCFKVVGGKITETGRLGAFITKVKKGSLADVVGHLRAGEDHRWKCRFVFTQ